MTDQAIEAEPTTGTALTVIPAASLPTLVEADKSDIIGRLRAELAGYIPDASTEDGRAEIGTKAREVQVETDRKEAQSVRELAARLVQEEAAAAVLKAAMDAERQRVADEKAAEEQALADRMKRRKHVEKINDEAISSIVGLGFGHDAAKFIVESIARRSVAHIFIAY